MASLTDLKGAGLLVLQKFTVALEDLGVEVPERRYRMPGSVPVWDGEQFTVNLNGVVQGQPGVPSVGSPVPPQARFYAAQWGLSLVRFLPVLQEGPLVEATPETEELDEAGAQGLDDVSALAQAAATLHSSYALTKPGQGFVVDSITPQGPEGGYFATRAVITLSLD